MKHIFLSFYIIICVALSAGAQLNPLSQLSLCENRKASRLSTPEEQPPYIPALMLLDGEGTTVDALRDMGVIFYNCRGNIHLTSIPRGKVGEVVAAPGILEISCASTASVCMDKAREFSFVDAVLSPAASRPAYTGKGVVTGISDIGFDPTHIAFRENLKGFGVFLPEQDASTFYDGPELAAAPSDNDAQRHATHVANILAGSFRGNPYFGVAPGSDFIATTSSLNDVGILMGVERIIEYAKARGSRAVINLSLSTSLGAHDGSSLMSAYLDLAAEDAVICISAGNNGYSPGYACREFSADGEEASLGLFFWNQPAIDSYVDLWGSDERPFELSFRVWDTVEERTVFSSPWISAIEEEPVEVNAPQLDGSVTFSGWLSPANGRCNATVHFDYTASEKATDGVTPRYAGYVTARAPQGVKVEAWADLDPLVLAVSPDGGESFEVTCDGTVNDMATARNVICVGSARSRNSVPMLTGADRTFDYPAGTVSDWSGFASRISGCRPLPDICAPGQNLISATSNFFMAGHPTFGNSAVSNVGGVDYFWHYDQGTSMASPFAAGVFALWLEADPSLSVQDIREIAASTARTDFADFPSAQWGPGCINAEAGLQEVLRRSASIIDTEAGNAAPTAVYTLSGVRLPHADLSRLDPGLYIVVSPSGSRKVRVN